MTFEPFITISPDPLMVIFLPSIVMSPFFLSAIDALPHLITNSSLASNRALVALATFMSFWNSP